MLLRKFVFLTVTMSAAGSLLAQVPSPKQQDFVYFSRAVTAGPIDSVPASDELIGKVRSTLSLSDAQVAALKTLLTMRSQATAQIRQTAIESQKKLEDSVNQSNPNPAEVGNAFLATRSVRDQLQAAREKFRLDFRASLSAEQRAVLDKLQAASEQTGSLAALDILDGSIDTHFVVDGPNPGAGIAIGFQQRLSKDR